jgi:hypothetical protein
MPRWSMPMSSSLSLPFAGEETMYRRALQRAPGSVIVGESWQRQDLLRRRSAGQAKPLRGRTLGERELDV